MHEQPNGQKFHKRELVRILKTAIIILTSSSITSSSSSESPVVDWLFLSFICFKSTRIVCRAWRRLVDCESPISVSVMKEFMILIQIQPSNDLLPSFTAVAEFLSLTVSGGCWVCMCARCDVTSVGRHGCTMTSLSRILGDLFTALRLSNKKLCPRIFEAYTEYKNINMSIISMPINVSYNIWLLIRIESKTLRLSSSSLPSGFNLNYTSIIWYPYARGH